MSKANGSYDKPGASTLKLALKIFGYTFLAGIMSIFVYFSITFVAESALKEQVGYYEYEIVNEETNETTILNKVLFAQTTTTASTTTAPTTTVTDAGGQTVTTVTDAPTTTTEGPKKVMIFEPKTGAAATTLNVVKMLAQLLLVTMYVTMAGYYIYREGDRDRNLVRHHQQAPTPWRGLIVGLLAAVPSAVIAALPILGKFGVMSDSVLGVYNTFNPTFLPLINAVIPTSVETATELTFLQIGTVVLVWMVLPVTGAVSYTLGYKRVFKPKKKKAK